MTVRAHPAVASQKPRYFRVFEQTIEAREVPPGLSASGLPTDRFFFEGFLPPREAARRTRIDELAEVPATLVFFETGPRIAAMLDDVAAGLGARPAAVCRELTKLHEEIRL